MIKPRIGLDLDNTIICYDSAFVTAARERRLISEEFTGTKQRVSDHIRKAHGDRGDTLWQELQGYVYGAGIHHARLFDGVKSFLARVKNRGVPLHIVSHKTEYGHFDTHKVNLREAAMQFLQEQGIFDYLPPDQVFFFSSRAEKIQKISELACDVFVDDLEEIFTDPAFPDKTRKLLFRTVVQNENSGIEVCHDWAQVERNIFDAG